MLTWQVGRKGIPFPVHKARNFFESRPDAEDMEEAKSKFMEGMEQQEHTGYNALHKLLQARAGSACACAKVCKQRDAGRGFAWRILA